MDLLILGLLGYCCPCILSWFIAEKLGANPLLYCLGGFFFPTMPLMRYKTREKFGIRVSNLDILSCSQLQQPPMSM